MSETSKRVLDTDYARPSNAPRLYGEAILLAREVEALEARTSRVEKERAASVAALENALDAHPEGAWMARALDAERELAAHRATSGDVLKEIAAQAGRIAFALETLIDVARNR